MKINAINNINYTPNFKGSAVAYPEFLKDYSASEKNAYRADAYTSDPISALVNKFAKAYRLLFTPEITASSKNIKEGIDTLFDAPIQGKQLNITA